jgi:hypothetical protein
MVLEPSTSQVRNPCQSALGLDRDERTIAAAESRSSNGSTASGNLCRAL